MWKAVMVASLFPEVEQAGAQHGRGVVWTVLNDGDLKDSISRGDSQPS